MNKIITIGREFGSGGRELGRRLAEALGYEYYDKEILTAIAKKTSLSEEYVKEVVDKTPHNLFPITVGQSFPYVDQYQVSQLSTIYGAQYEIVRELAEKSNCVFVGRCADYILKDYNPYRIFVYADKEFKIQRCLNREDATVQLTYKEVEKNMKKVDKGRAKYYNYYTGNKWGDIRNYELCINTTNKVIKNIVPVIAKMFIENHE